MAVRFVRPHILRTDPSPPEFITFHPPEAGLMYPPFYNWRVCRQHQWMILTREFVKHIRESEEAITALAFSEHTWVPDENYFCYVALNTPKFAPHVVSDNKRYVTFQKMHARTLEYDNRNELEVPNLYDDPGFAPPPQKTNEESSPQSEEEKKLSSERDNPRYLFVRKVDVRTEGGAGLFKWIQETHAERFMSRVPGFYGRLGGESWTTDPYAAEVGRMRFVELEEEPTPLPSVGEKERESGLLAKEKELEEDKK
ncbi:hypothetical protein HDU67_008177 [Dinochytrium kinnereticum]|nr:hypothetical protein HDU67_008177 [Dinochytrium kinnereticum]